MKRWVIWTVFAIAWTVSLEAPVPVPEPDPDAIVKVTLKVLFTKSVHVAAYAVFAMLSAWPRVPLRYRLLMIFFLMAHATATEMVQEAMHEHWGRTGKLSDVAFDQVGILIGLMIGWKWWTRPD